MPKEEFEESRSAIKVYKKEIEGKGKDILDVSKKFETLDNYWEIILEGGGFIRMILDAISLQKKLIDAQDKYIKELEKIVNRMR